MYIVVYAAARQRQSEKAVITKSHIKSIRLTTNEQSIQFTVCPLRCCADLLFHFVYVCDCDVLDHSPFLSFSPVIIQHIYCVPFYTIFYNLTAWLHYDFTDLTSVIILSQRSRRECDRKNALLHTYYRQQAQNSSRLLLIICARGERQVCLDYHIIFSITRMLYTIRMPEKWV